MSPHTVIVGGFAVILLLMLAIDLTARRSHRTLAPLATALTAAMRTPTGRLVVLGWWVWLGWHFLAR
jgi:hypothetical protein